MSRRAWSFALAALAATSAAGCGDKVPSLPPPTDQYYFPTGLAVRHVPAGCVPGAAGCRTELLTVSSNFDLRYDPALGGTVISIDVDRALADAAVPGAPSPLPVQPLGAAAIGSFGGELAILDAETCPGWTGPEQALVAARSVDTLYRLDIDAAGGLSCGAGCRVPLLPDLADPYGVTVACGTWPPAQGLPASPQAFAFVTYLRSPDAYGWLSRVDLAATDATGLQSSPLTRVPMQIAPTHQSFFDRATGRLYVTGRYAGPGYDPLRWLELSTPGLPTRNVNLDTEVRGSETRSLALSSDGTRGYLAMRMYDSTLTTVYGQRPPGDVAGALLVLDMTEAPAGGPAVRPLRTIPLDRGATQARVLARPGRRDLVVAVSSDDSSIAFYDDDVGALVATWRFCGDQPGTNAPPAAAPCSPGQSLTGVQPYGLAVEQLPSGLARLYVGSFDRGWVNVIEIDPAHPERPPSRWVRLGTERQ